MIYFTIFCLDGLFVPKETLSLVFSRIEPNEKGNSTTGSQGNAKRVSRDLKLFSYFCTLVILKFC